MTSSQTRAASRSVPQQSDSRVAAQDLELQRVDVGEGDLFTSGRWEESRPAAPCSSQRMLMAEEATLRNVLKSRIARDAKELRGPRPVPISYSAAARSSSPMSYSRHER